MRGRPLLLAIVLALALTLPGVSKVAATTASERPQDAPGAAWTVTARSPAPPSAAGTLMAFDDHAGRFVLFGGWDGTTAMNETWQLDPRNGSWAVLSPPRAPPPRADAMFVYDPVDDRFLLFGGWYQYPNGTYIRYDDLWSFSLDADRWSPMASVQPPSPRSDSGVAFDAADDLLILFGGFSGSAYLGGTYAYSPASGTWTNLSPSGPVPGPRADGRLTYDPTDGAVVLFGGNDFSGPNFSFHHLADTWTFRYAARAWTDRTSSVAPEPRDYAVQTYDPVTRSVLLFGGYGAGHPLGDLWAWDPATGQWHPLDAASPPPPRFAGVGGFDTVDQELVVVGGLGAAGLLNDTWTLRSIPGPSPTPGGSDAWAWTATGLLVVAVVISEGIRRGR